MIDEEDLKKIKKYPIRKSNKIGRPKKYETAKDLQKAIDGYFDWLDEQNEIRFQNRLPTIAPTVADLTRSVGFESRSTLWRLKSVSNEFKYVIEGAKLRIEAHMERIVSNNSSFAYGWLKQNVPEEWGDKKEDDVINPGEGGNVTIKITKQYGKMDEKNE